MYDLSCAPAQPFPLFKFSLLLFLSRELAGWPDCHGQAQSGVGFVPRVLHLQTLYSQLHLRRWIQLQQPRVCTFLCQQDCLCASEALGATGESCRFHLVGYSPRMWAIAALMAGSYWTVAFSATRPWQLLGVAFGAAQVLFPPPSTPPPPQSPSPSCGAVCTGT